MIPEIVTNQMDTIWQDAVNATLWAGLLQGILALFLITGCITICCLIWRKYKEGEADETDVAWGIAAVLMLLFCILAIDSSLPNLMAPEAEVYEQLFGCGCRR